MSGHDTVASMRQVTGKATVELVLLVVCLLVVLAAILSVTVMIGWVVEHVSNMVRPD